MDKKIIDKILSLVIFATAIFLTIYYVRRIPVFMKIFALGMDALIFYWFYTVWGFNKKKSNHKERNLDK